MDRGKSHWTTKGAKGRERHEMGSWGVEDKLRPEIDKSASRAVSSVMNSAATVRGTVGERSHAMLSRGISGRRSSVSSVVGRRSSVIRRPSSVVRRPSSVAFTPPVSRSWSRSQCGSTSPFRGRLRCTRLRPPGRGIRRRAAPCAGRDRRGTCARKRSACPARHPG